MMSIPSIQSAAGANVTTTDRPASPAIAGPNTSAKTDVERNRISGTTTASAVSGVAEANESRTAENRENLRISLEDARGAANSSVRDLSFSIHDKTGDMVVRIIDRESKEVIRQIPAEEMLRIAEFLLETEGQSKPGLLLTQEV